VDEYLVQRSVSKVVVTGSYLPGDRCPGDLTRSALELLQFNSSIHDLERWPKAPVDMHEGRAAVQRDLDWWEESTVPPCTWGRIKGQPCPEQAESEQ